MMDCENNDMSNVVSETSNRRNMHDVTYLIEASSRNRMCQLILRHVTRDSLEYINGILNTNPIIGGLLRGQKYEHFRGTLITYSYKEIEEVIAWVVFWCDFIGTLLEDYDTNIQETINCFVSGMSFEAYCVELGRFETEIEAMTDACSLQDMKEFATACFDTIE
nr:expressed protein [Hymenolepis microstoma]